MNCKSIGVFCASSETIDSFYVYKARELGKWLGNKNLTLVYGGIAKGLMEAVAVAAKTSGAHIVGVVPESFSKRNTVSAVVDECVVVSGLGERKEVMLERSDFLIALPGGIGTLDEILHVMATFAMGYNYKKIIFYNLNGFWDNLLLLFCEYREKGFLRKGMDECFVVANDFEELKMIMENI